MSTMEGIFGVVGAGQMGAGIAQVAAHAGFQVLLVDATPELAARGRERIAAALKKLVERGKLLADQRDASLARLQSAGGLDALAGAALVVEAVSEDEALKRTLFQQLDAVTAPECILASNTSSISITRLAA